MEGFFILMRKYTLAYCLLFFAALTWTAKHCIPALDEVMLLDPCVNFLHGNYGSKLWYAAGTEEHFMAYLPASSVFRIPFLLIFPIGTFYYKLPFILLFAVCAWLLYKIIRSKFENETLAWLTVFLFINDKGLWDSTFSGRSELLQVCFILLFFYIEIKNHSVTTGILKGLIIGCLVLTHPPAWIIALILTFFLYRKSHVKVFIISIGFVLLPILIYLFTINFKISELFSQLFMEGTLARANETFLHRLIHSYERMLPYPYLFQPWVPLLFLACLFFILSFKVHKETFVRRIGIVFFAYSFFLVFFSDNYYRYNPPLLACMYLLLPFVIEYLRIRYSLKQITNKLLVLTIIIITMPFVARCYNIYLTRNSTNTEVLIQDFRETKLGNEQTKLIVGEPIGYYMAASVEKAEYATIYTMHKFNLNNYDRVFFLTYDNLDEKKYQLQKEFQPGEIKSGTFKGLKIYESK